MTHLFRVEEKIWDSVDYDTILDTAIALEKAGLDQPPYAVFDIQATLNHKIMARLFSEWDKFITRAHAPTRTFTFRYEYDKENNHLTTRMKINESWLDHQNIEKICKYNSIDPARLHGEIEYISSFLNHTLFALLATKNAQKTTEKVKKHGPKSRKRPREYDYITTIKIGKITETQRGDGDGQSSVRPHLRRGHIRNQRVGKGLSEVKPIFIQPCFINADESWINNQRKEYRIAA